MLANLRLSRLLLIMSLTLDKTSKFGSFLALNFVLKNNSYAKENGVEIEEDENR